MFFEQFDPLQFQVTDDGDILYVFPGFAGGNKARKCRTGKAKTMEAFETDQRMGEASEQRFEAMPEVLQFEVQYNAAFLCPKHWRNEVFFVGMRSRVSWSGSTSGLSTSLSIGICDLLYCMYLKECVECRERARWQRARHALLCFLERRLVHR